MTAIKGLIVNKYWVRDMNGLSVRFERFEKFKCNSE